MQKDLERPFRRDREHSCEGKSPFLTFAQAVRALRRMLKRRGRDAAKQRGMHVYRCPYCPAYHIGHNRVLVKRKGFKAAS